MKLDVAGLDVAYGRTQVLFDVSFSVPDGALVCLMGRNGMGKSTFMHTICGLLAARAGTVSVDGRDITRMAPYERARLGIGYVPQGHQVFPQLSAMENLMVVHERTRSRDRAAIDDALDVFPKLRPLLDRPAGLLSGGQAQQLAIARTLVTRPRLLVLDEPTEGIQPSIIAEIEDTVAELHRGTGMSILLVEQYVEFALRLAERFAIMEEGRIVRSGATADADAATFGELLAV